MPKSIEEQLTQEALKKALSDWADMVVNKWESLRPETSPEHFLKKGFTRDQLHRLAAFARSADDVFQMEIRKNGNKYPTRDTWGPSEAGWFILNNLYREVGYVIGFLQFAREEMAEEFGYFKNKKGVRERHLKDGKIEVNARMFLALKRNPIIAAFVLQECEARNIVPSNKDFVRILEERGSYAIMPSAVKDSTRLARVEKTAKTHTIDS